MSGIAWIIYLAIIVLIVAGWWMMFTKAGAAGWQAIIPIWNVLVLLKIIGRDWWWLILFFIPIANIVAVIVVSIDLAKSFGRGTGFVVGLIFLPFVFVPILGFGNAEYRGTAAAAA